MSAPRSVSSSDAAAVEAQSTGKSPALCAADSPFMDKYDQCTLCVERYPTDTTNDTIPAPVPDVIASSFSEFLEYCESLDNNTDIIDVNSLLASWSSLAITQSAIQETLSSLGYTNFSTTATTMETAADASGLETAGTATPTATSVNGDGEVENGNGDETTPGSAGPPVGVIAPAVVVPVVVCLVAAVIAWMFMRRRRKRWEIEKAAATGDGFDGKAQLHADAFRPELDGLGTAKKNVLSVDEDEDGLAELPAREPVGAEMDGQGRRELDGEGRKN
ncbi:hypothetical protein BDW71DRAFT_203557 [Aspergillus fruticulosus]